MKIGLIATSSIADTALFDTAETRLVPTRYGDTPLRMFRMLGGDVIGHTGVTETILAREAGLCHVCIALVSNLAAGIGAEPISNESVSEVRHRCQERLDSVVRNVISLIYKQWNAGCHCAAASGVPQFPAWDAVLPAAP